VSRKIIVFAILVALTVPFSSIPGSQVQAFVGWIGANGNHYIPNDMIQPENVNISSNEGDSFSTKYSLALDKAGNPNVCWDDSTSGNNEVCFVKWNGDGWVNIKGEPYPENPAIVSMTETSSENPVIVLDPATDYPRIAWIEYLTDENKDIFYVAWNGKSWVNAKGMDYPKNPANVTNNKGFSVSPVLVLDAKGWPIIAWDDDAWGNSEVCFLRWDGTQWIAGPGKPYPNNSPNVSLNEGYSQDPSLKLDNQGNAHLAWTDNTDWGGEIYYVRWNGKAWVTAYGSSYPTNSANISKNEGDSADTSIDLDENGYVHVVWTDDTPGNYETYYIRWDGKRFVTAKGKPYPTNSGNVSWKSGVSANPSIALNSKGVPNIAWDDDSSGVVEIYFIKLTGTYWSNSVNQSYPWSPGNLNKGAVSDNFKPSLVLDTAGLPHIVWNARYKLVDGNIAPNSAKNATKYLREIHYMKFTQKFEGSFDLKMSVDTDSNGVFDNDNAVIPLKSMLTYQGVWKYEDKNDPMQNAYVYAKVPDVGRYVMGARPIQGLIHSLDNGLTWDSGEPPASSAGGSILCWKVPVWVGAANIPFSSLTEPTPDIALHTASPETYSSKYCILLDKNETPHICFDADKNGNNEVFYVKWNGVKWVNAKGESFPEFSANVSDSAGISSLASFALDSKGNPHVAWDEGIDENNEICYVKWDGTRWVNANEQGHPENPSIVSSNPSYSGYPSLALDSKDVPYIAWNDMVDKNAEIFCVKLVDKKWVTLDGKPYPENSAIVSQTSGASLFPSLVLDSKDNPNIAWSDSSSGNYEIWFAKWDGTKWVNVKNAEFKGSDALVSLSENESMYPSLALGNDDLPHIAWQDKSEGDKEIFYLYFDGEEWVTVQNKTYPAYSANVSQDFGNSELPQLVLDNENNPHIVWDDDTIGEKVVHYVKWGGWRWVNAQNQPYPSCSAVVSYNDGKSVLPAIALSAQGKPHIVWGGITEDVYTVYYVKKAANEFTFKFNSAIDLPKKADKPICSQAWFVHQYNGGKAVWSNNVCVTTK
jgi:hypothetical protein